MKDVFTEELQTLFTEGAAKVAEWCKQYLAPLEGAEIISEVWFDREFGPDRGDVPDAMIYSGIAARDVAEFRTFLRAAAKFGIGFRAY